MSSELGHISADGKYIRFSDWHMVNPESPEFVEAYHKLRQDPQALTQSERYLLLGALDSYYHLTTHPAPTKWILDQLRQVRATLKRSKRVRKT